MEAHVQNPHSPSQERLLSNFGHWVEGAIIAASGVSSMRGVLSADDRHRVHQSSVLIGAGGVLAAGLIAGSFHHGGPVSFFRANMQQREHLKMAALIVGAGTLRRLSGRTAALSNVLVARVGQMFLIHEQHGTDEAAARARKRHEILGKTIVGAAAAEAIGDLSRWRWARALGGAMMLAAGVQLLSYREPGGAYE